jgi:tyrosine-protein phosphatase YwqE
MKLAIAEDLINLMILNRDDSEFVMKDLFENKEEFYNIIMKEFFTKNSSSVIQELKHMEHYKPKMNSKRKG